MLSPLTINLPSAELTKEDGLRFEYLFYMESVTYYDCHTVKTEMFCGLIS